MMLANSIQAYIIFHDSIQKLNIKLFAININYYKLQNYSLLYKHSALLMYNGSISVPQPSGRKVTRSQATSYSFQAGR